jgi:hypothetical protein
MDRRKFVGASMLTAASLAAQPVLAGENQSNNKEFYEWREYEIKWGGSGQAILHTFFEKTLIPALNKYGVKNVGVFREIGKTEPPKIYLLIPYPSFAEYLSIWEKINKDAAFLEGRQAYDKVPADKPLFSRVHTSMMIAFDGMPKMKIPAEGERIFELRLYEGYSEDAVRRKLKMFNVEEFDIFYRVKLNPVFFGETIAGNNLPSLLYMIWFKNMQERDANWKAFSDDAAWKKVLADPQYANTVSNIIRVFLEPLAYSQV